MSLFTNSIPSGKRNMNTKTTTASSQSVHSVQNRPIPSAVPLEKGQIIKGDVIDLRNEQVTIQLNNGDMVKAQLSEPSELNIGQRASFKIENISLTEISVKHIANSQMLSQDITINKALEEANLPKTDKNKQIIRELLNNQMSIDKQSINKILQQCYQYKDATISTLVLMNRYQIPFSSANVTQLEHYQNQDGKILSELTHIAEEIPTLLEQISQLSSKEDFLSFQTQLIDLLSINYTKEKLANPPLLIETGKQASLLSSLVQSQNPLAPVILSPDESLELIDLLENFSLSSEQRIHILNGTASVREVAHTIQESMKLADEIDQTNLQLYLQTDREAPNSDTIAAELLQEVPLVKEGFDLPSIHTILNAFEAITQSNDEISSYLNEEAKNALLEVVKEFPVSDKLLSSIQQGDITSSELIQILQEFIPFGNTKSIAKLQTDKSYQLALKKHITNCLTLSLSEVNKEDIDTFYSNLYKQASDLKEFTASQPNIQIHSNLGEQASNLKDNLDFMRMLNSMLTYTQLPVKLKHQIAHSDLYVLTNKHSLMSKKDSISVLLHLDMDNLGSTDIHLNLTGNQITSKFYVNETNTSVLLKEHMNQLADLLLKKGFFLNSEVLIREKEFNIIDNLMKKDEKHPSSNVKRYTFDIRA